MALSRGVFAGGPRQAMNTFVRSMSSSHKAPVTVAVTGAAGQIGYATLMRIANGELLGKDQPINLKLIEVQQGLKPLKGVMMEVQDGAFPLLKSMTGTADLHEGFGDADYAILIGAKPRGPGMERGDLMSANASIFKEQGKALNKAAKKNVKALVVGNPANTNALVLSANAPNIDPMNIHAMTRLDQNRALAQLALKLKTGVSNIEKVSIILRHITELHQPAHLVQQEAAHCASLSSSGLYLGQPLFDAVSGCHPRSRYHQGKEDEADRRHRSQVVHPRVPPHSPEAWSSHHQCPRSIQCSIGGQFGNRPHTGPHARSRQCLVLHCIPEQRRVQGREGSVVFHADNMLRQRKI